MAANKTNPHRSDVADLLKNATPTVAATNYLALFTSDPTVTGTAGTEVSGSGYARQPITWGTTVNGSISNSGTIAFPVATGSYGTVTHLGICNHITTAASTSGVVKYFGAWDTAKAINLDDQFQVNSGDLSVDET